MSQQLGKYQLVAEIARGGMGVVYLAVAHGPARFSKLLVVKELKAELAEDGTFLDMFLEEARLAARLNHPNIVQTYEIGAEGKRHFMVMDYLDGVTLARILRQRSDRFTLPMHLRLICETLQGLDYAHTLKDFDGTPLGVVHRDATPQNVFLTFDGTVKLVDFGIAKALDTTVETRAGVLKGKPAYMAPEQIGGDVDPRADVFAVGVMVWEAVVGRPMWHKKGDVEILTKIIQGNIPTLKEAKPDAPEQLIRICDRALARSRDDRYPTAADLQADLEAYLVASKTDVSVREVGKIIAEMFSAERLAMRTTIEQHIASLKAGKPVDRLPSLRPPQMDSNTTPIGAKVGSLQLAAPPSFSPPPPSTSPSLVTGPGTPGGTEMPSGASDALARELAGKKQKVTISIALGAGAIALIGIAALRFGGAKPVAPLEAPVAKAAPSSEAPAGATHEASLRVRPPNATISIDGVPLSNPVKRTCVHGQRVVMYAAAPNYVSIERELRCEQDETVDLSLQPAPTAARSTPPPPAWAVAPVTPPGKKPPPPPPPPSVAEPVASPAPPPPPTTAKPSDVSPTGGSRPNRPIDTANPYGNQ